MTFSVWQKYITDGSGNILPSASIEVRNEQSGLLETLYSDPNGSALSNPFSADLDGFAQFFAAAGRYKIVATKDAEIATFRYEQVGEAKEKDVGTDPEHLITVEDADVRYENKKLNNYNATTPPTPNDDETLGYEPGSRWFDISVSPTEAYVCIDATTGAADWAKTTLTLDELGSMATKNAGTAADEFKDNEENDDTFLFKALSVVEVAGTARTLTAADNGKMLKTTNASPVTITVPEDATEALDAGFQCIVQRAGDGLVTFVSEGSDDLNAADNIFTVDVKYGAASVVKEASGDWWMTGALQAVLEAGNNHGDTVSWNSDTQTWESVPPTIEAANKNADLASWNSATQKYEGFTYREVVLEQSTTTTQNPVGTDAPLQISFGAAVGSGADPVQLDVNGTVTINEPGKYEFNIHLQYGRTGGLGSSILLFRAEVDGTPDGNVVATNLDNADSDLPLFHPICLGDLAATQEVEFYLVRDSAGNNSGGLLSVPATLAGWDDAPSAAIKVTRVLTRIQ